MCEAVFDLFLLLDRPAYILKGEPRLGYRGVSLL